jgi:hypothetical protein
MRAKNVKKEFLRYIAGRGESLETMRPLIALEMALAFYRDVRADECDQASDQDMLLFQWGTYHWGTGNHFELGMTRQFIFNEGDDEDIRQFHVRSKFPPSEELGRLVSGDRWCHSLAELPSFALFVREHPVCAAVDSRGDASLSLEFECAG